MQVAPTVTRIIGLDPGLRHTGWGVIETQGNRLRYIAHGIIAPCPTLELAQRLNKLFQGLMDVIHNFSPDEAAVEETFVNAVNAASALKLGMARGVVLMAPASANLLVAEYSANKVKKSVVGVGHADKVQVSMMVQRLLPTCGAVKADAADALAVAICHAHHRQTSLLMRA
jgi:crossover junction endodeoxyribonuclease RuvC